MSSQVVCYECEVCKYVNRWTRNEILQDGEQMIYKGQYVDHKYSVRCQNPAAPRCNGRYEINVPIWEA